MRVTESQLRRMIRHMINENVVLEDEPIDEPTEDPGDRIARIKRRRGELMQKPLPEGTKELIGVLERHEGDGLRPEVGYAMVEPLGWKLKFPNSSPGNFSIGVDQFLRECRVIGKQPSDWAAEWASFGPSASLRVYKTVYNGTEVMLVHPND